eukprot:1471318-Pleurochrysis_carterae.AAC.1
MCWYRKTRPGKRYPHFTCCCRRDRSRKTSAYMLPYNSPTFALITSTRHRDGWKSLGLFCKWLYLSRDMVRVEGKAEC